MLCCHANMCEFEFVVRRAVSISQEGGVWRWLGGGEMGGAGWGGGWEARLMPIIFRFSSFQVTES